MKIRAAVLDRMGAKSPYAERKPLHIATVELDAPGRGEVLVRIAAAGLCHSDLSVINGDRPRPMPMALGHESAGVVETVGEDVPDLVPGDHVVMVFMPSCGHCILDSCIAEIARRAGVPRVNLLGLCEGGVFTTAYAALEPTRVNTLGLTITPIDFHADTVENRPGHGFINLWTRSLAPEDIDRLIEAHGNLPGQFMGAVFNQMSPMRSMLKYNVDMLEVLEDETRLLNWLRMEKWIADRPDHPGEAAKHWLQDLYQQNKLVQNEWTLDGRLVDLGKVTMPVLNVYAKDDHIIPPATSRAIGPKLGTKDYTELALPGGHVGVFVGGRSQKLFAPGVAAFLEKHDQVGA